MEKAKLLKYLKRKILPLLKAIFSTAVLTFISYAFLSQFVGAGMLDGYFSQFEANLLASIISTVLYALWFHWFYTTSTNKTYVLHVKTETPFNFLQEGKAFFKEDGIPYLIVYGVFTVFFEAIIGTSVLSGSRMNWLFAYAYSALFPLKIADDALNLFLSPLISIIALLILILFFALVSRKRLHKKLSKQ